jgi:putative glutamine amidotransferase
MNMQRTPHRPVIGITVAAFPDYAGRRLRDDYWQKVQAAGGLPLLLPPLLPALAPQLAASLDGLLLSGGGDFSAADFGQEARLAPRDPDPLRDAFELELIRVCWQRRLPMLGICRGMQAMNIALGGNLHQHLEAGGSIAHDQAAPRQETSHQVRIVSAPLAALLGREIAVNSHHHQAVDQVAAPFLPAAYAPDGVLEALIARERDRFALGVQWHPEALARETGMFMALVSAANELRLKRGNMSFIAKSIAKTLHSNSPALTAELARKIGALVPAGTVLAISGPLGAGKTVFAAGLARGLGVDEIITSPTYIYFQSYPGRQPFCHVDAYRLQGLSEEEIALTGVEECFARVNVTLVEWPEYVAAWLPPETIHITITPGPDAEAREISFTYTANEDWLHEIIGD